MEREEPAPNAAPPSTVVCAADAEEGWRWLAPGVDGVRWEFAVTGRRRWFERLLPRPNLAYIRVGLQAAVAARRTGAQTVIAHEPRIAFWVAAGSALVGIRPRVLAHTFNFTKLPHTLLPAPIARVIFAAAFARIDRFVVFSQFEIDLYSRYFGIPKERFELLLWGMDPVEVKPGPPLVEGEYVCAIGGNARDYATLLEAARQTPDVSYVLVVRPDSLIGLDVPTNVTVHVNLPFTP